jgi:hypothetical protein
MTLWNHHPLTHTPIDSLASDGIATTQVVSIARTGIARLTAKAGVKRHDLTRVFSDTDDI